MKRFDTVRYLCSAIVVVLVIPLSGCAKRAKTPPVVAPQVDGSPTQADNRIAPLDIQIKNASVSEGELLVSALVTAKGDLPGDTVALTLKGLSGGDLLREQTVSLKEVFPVTTLYAGQRVLFDLRIDATGLTEYQLVSAWGEEAKLSSPPKLPIQSSLIITDRVESKESCEGCEGRTVVQVTLTNNGQTVVEGIQLATSIYFEDDVLKVTPTSDLLPQLPGETVTELPSLRLESGQSKQVQVRIDRDLPKLAVGRFRPWVRLLGFNQQKQELPQK